MSCNCSDFANINSSLFSIQTNFNNLTGNILYNYNQLTRVSSQQSNITSFLLNNNANIASQTMIISNLANISRNTN